MYHAALLPEYLPRGIDILADIPTPEFARANDFTTEKQQVILEEIRYVHFFFFSISRDQWRDLARGRPIFKGLTTHLLGKGATPVLGHGSAG